MKKIVLMLLFLVMVTAVYSAKSYRILSRGMVRDNSTNLIWTRCPLTTGDKPIYDFQCKGDKKAYTWEEAVDVCRNLVHEGRSDWRLPSITELQSIVFYHHYITNEENLSQVPEQVFPGTITKSDLENDYSITYSTLCYYETCHLHYWSSTPAGLHPFFAGVSLYWALNFNEGVVQKDSFYFIDLSGVVHYDQPKKKSVRCVAGP